jgi:heptosyltransferase-1
MTNAETGNILVVRVGRAGDLVMITPALRLLLDAFPGSEFHVLTGADGRRALEGFDPRITEFHVYDRKFPASITGPARLVRELGARGYARAYVFETHSRYRELAGRLTPRVYALDERSAGEHYSARCLAVVAGSLERAPARDAAYGAVSLPVTDAGRNAAAEYLARHGIAPDERLVGIHMTFSESARGLFAGRRGRKHRMWPQAEAARLAHLLADAGRTNGTKLRPVVDVLPGERGMLHEFLAGAGDDVTVLCGPSDFERYKAVLARLDALVTPNTGPMHIGAAVGTPVVALFSGWSPADCGPFVPAGRVRVLRAEDTKEPDRGLAAISAEAAFQACLELLKP